jgi:uncharacterized protein YdhG (YjbR/CyaY superfamily)
MKKKTVTAAPEISTIDQYIVGFPAETQGLLRQMRQLIHAAAPAATEAMKYRIPTFVLNGNLVHFAAFERHLGFYPTPSAMMHFQRQLAGYVTAKGSVQFPLDRPIPWDLIREMVLFRVAEASGRTKGKTQSASGGQRKQSAAAPPEDSTVAAPVAAGKRKAATKGSTSPKAAAKSAGRAVAKKSAGPKRSK